MFSTISGYIFGASGPEEGPLECQGQGPPAEADDWVVVKDEEKTFLLSTEVVTRSRVNVHEDLSRENFLIENPLSLSSEEIQMRGIKIGRRKKRKGKRTSPGGSKGRSSPANYQALLPDDPNPTPQASSRVLTPKNNNNRGQGLLHAGQDKRRENYHYRRYSGYNNDRKCGQQRC